MPQNISPDVLLLSKATANENKARQLCEMWAMFSEIKGLIQFQQNCLS